MKTEPFKPQVCLDRDNNYRPVIVFRKGRKLYHAVISTPTSISLGTFESLRRLDPLLTIGGGLYPPRGTASYWLNHGHREITKRAKAVLQGLVSRKPKAEAVS